MMEIELPRHTNSLPIKANNEVKPYEKVNVIFLDRIKQVREEISNHCQGAKDGQCDLCWNCRKLMGVREILETLDKLIESEVEK